MRIKIAILCCLLLTSFMGCKKPVLQQFTDVSESSGIHFANNITESAA